MSAQPQTQLSMIERIERALLLLAYFFEHDGDIHVPMYQKFEAELAELRTAEAVRERAMRRLADFRRAREPSSGSIPDFGRLDQSGAPGQGLQL